MRYDTMVIKTWRDGRNRKKPLMNVVAIVNGMSILTTRIDI